MAEKYIELSIGEKGSVSVLEGSKEETIEAINSVPSIRNKEKIIANLPDSARLIKNFPVLTEGVYNGLYFPEDVIRRDAETWLEHEKPGMTRKVKMEHKSGVMKRIGHIVGSRFDESDKFMKQNLLILDKDGIEKWDNGFLDDPSIRSKYEYDIGKSKPGRIHLTSLKGVGTDFVDKPACKICGLDAALAELSEEESEEVVELMDKESKEFGMLREAFDALFGQSLEPDSESPDEALINAVTVNLNPEGVCALEPEAEFAYCLTDEQALELMAGALEVEADIEAIITEALNRGIISEGESDAELDGEDEDIMGLDEKTLKEKFNDFITSLFSADEEEVEEAPVEEEVEEEEEEVEENTPQTENQGEGAMENFNVQTEAPAGVAALSEEDVEAKITAMWADKEAELEEKIEAKYKDRIAQLEQDVTESKDAERDSKIVELSAELVQLESVFGIKSDAKTYAELSEEQSKEEKIVELNEKINTVKGILEKIPEGEVPRVFDANLEEELSKEEEKTAELSEKRKNIYRGE